MKSEPFPQCQYTLHAAALVVGPENTLDYGASAPPTCDPLHIRKVPTGRDPVHLSFKFTGKKTRIVEWTTTCEH